MDNANLKNDVFISCRTDEVIANPTLKKWIDNLKYFLNIILSKKLHREVAVCTSFDLEFSEENLKPKSLRKIEESATYIFALTENYQDSGNSRAELEAIFKSLEKTKRTNRFSRIFKIKHHPIDAAHEPEPLRKIISTDFFIPNAPVDEEKEDSAEFYSTQTEQNFWFKIVDLAFDMKNVLNALSGEIQQSKIARTVFLADVCTEQIRNRNIIRRELIQHGYKILPDRLLSTNPLMQKGEIVDYLSQSILSIHIIGEEYGPTFKKSTLSYVDLQNKVAAEYYERTLKDKEDTRNFSRILWLPPNLEIKNERQQEYVQQLKHDSEALAGADVLETPIEVLKSTIQKQCETNAQKNIKQNQKKKRKKEEKDIYIVYEKNDENNAFPIIQWFKNKNFPVALPLFKGEKMKIIDTHRKNLIKAQGILIVFNSNNYNWLKSKLLDILKAPGYGKTNQFLARAIFVDSKIVDNVRKIINKNMEIIENICENEDKFAHFLKKMNIHD